MSSDLLTGNDAPPEREGPPDPEKAKFIATVVRYAAVPDECTIHPLNPSDDELMTSWVTALEGSFLALSDIR